MADLQKTVEIIFGGRNELSKVIGEVESSLSGLESATEPFANLADNILKAESAVLALGVAFAGLSINQAGTFGDQFAEITTLIDKNVGDLGGYRQEILDYAKDSTQSLESITGAVYSAISAGVDYNSAIGVMSEAEKLAVAGKADLNSTLVALASTMNAYGADVKDASDYSDVFFTTVKQGQTTIPELAASLSQVTSTAVAAGVPFDDLSAAIAALTASGMPTSQAITAIKAALSNIIKPSSEAEEAAAALGLKFDVAALKSDGLAGFLGKVYTATGGNVTEMGKLFGSVEALNGVMALGADKSGIFAKSLTAMDERAGATAAAFEKMVENFSLNNQRLVNNIQVVLIGTGSKLLDEYKGVIDALIANLQGIGTAIDKGDLDGFIGVFESAMSDISELLSGIAKVLPEALSGIDWSGFGSAFDGLESSVGNAFSTVFGNLDLSTVDGVREAIQTVVDLLSGLTNVSAGVIDGMQPLWTAIGTLATKFSEADASGQEFSGNILGVGKSVNTILGFVNSATGSIGGLTAAMLLMGGSSVINSATKVIGLFSGSSGLTSALSAALPIMGKLSLAGGALWAGYEIGEAISNKVIDATVGLSDAQDEAARGAQKLAERFSEVSKETGVNITSMEELDQAVKDGLIHWDDASATWKSSSESMTNLGETAQTVSQGLQEFGLHIDKDGNIQEFLDKTYVGLNETKFAAGEVNTAWRQTADGVYTNLGVVSQSIDKVTASETKAKEESDELKKTMLELASDERIKSMELAVDLHLEQIKADAEVAKAAFESISDSVSSANDLIGDLGGSISGLGDITSGNWLSFEALRSSMQKADDRAEQLTDAQVELIGAQADYLAMKTDSLRNGGSLITITGDGLAPQLEAFMWEVLKAIQVRAAEENSAFLLGI